MYEMKDDYETTNSLFLHGGWYEKVKDNNKQ